MEKRFMNYVTHKENSQEVIGRGNPTERIQSSGNLKQPVIFMNIRLSSKKVSACDWPSPGLGRYFITKQGAESGTWSVLQE